MNGVIFHADQPTNFYIDLKDYRLYESRSDVLNLGSREKKNGGGEGGGIDGGIYRILL